jgi:hypothetical protein
MAQCIESFYREIIPVDIFLTIRWVLKIGQRCLSPALIFSTTPVEMSVPMVKRGLPPFHDVVEVMVYVVLGVIMFEDLPCPSLSEVRYDNPHPTTHHTPRFRDPPGPSAVVPQASRTSGVLSRVGSRNQLLSHEGCSLQENNVWRKVLLARWMIF